MLQPVVLSLQRKGGTGKTLTACALAAYYQAKGIEFRLIDCDVGAGDLRNKHPETEVVGFDKAGIAAVFRVLDAGKATVLDFGANTTDIARPMIQQLLASQRTAGRRVVFLVPFDQGVKSRVFVVEMLRDYPEEIVIGAAVTSATGVPPAPKALAPDRLLVIPRLSKRIADKGYDGAAQSIINMMQDGRGVTKASANNFVAAETRSFMRLFSTNLDRFAHFITPRPLLTPISQ